MDETKKTAAAPMKKTKLDPKRLVTIKLFRDNNKYKEPLYVCVNDYSAQIKRGVSVQVPYYVAKHIEEMNTQDEATAMMVEGLVQEYDKQNQ